MNTILDIAVYSDHKSFNEGAEDGYWAGFREGMEQSRRHIMGERETNPWDDIPEDFRALGSRYLKMDV